MAVQLQFEFQKGAFLFFSFLKWQVSQLIITKCVWFRQHDEENIHKCCKWWERSKKTQKNLSTNLFLLDVMIILKDKWYLAARNTPIWWLKDKSIFFEQNMLIWSFQLLYVNHLRCKIMHCSQKIKKKKRNKMLLWNDVYSISVTHTAQNPDASLSCQKLILASIHFHFLLPLEPPREKVLYPQSLRRVALPAQLFT